MDRLKWQGWIPDTQQVAAPSEPPVDDDVATPPDPPYQSPFAHLLFEPYTWIERQSETISYLSTAETRRHSVFQIMIPDSYPASENGSIFVPLMLLGKRALARFETRDGDGRLLPTLNMESNWKYSSDAAS